MRSFRATLWRIVKTRGLSQAELARQANVHPPSINSWLAGKDLPTPELFDRLHQVLPEEDLLSAWLAEKAWPTDRLVQEWIWRHCKDLWLNAYMSPQYPFGQESQRVAIKAPPKAAAWEPFVDMLNWCNRYWGFGDIQVFHVSEDTAEISAQVFDVTVKFLVSRTEESNATLWLPLIDSYTVNSEGIVVRLYDPRRQSPEGLLEIRNLENTTI